MKVDVDPRTLTQDEWAQVCRVVDGPPSDVLDRLDDDDVAALTWVTLRREDPDLSLDEVRDDLAATEQVDDVPDRWSVDVMARVCVALRMSPGEFRAMTPVEVAAVVNVLDEEPNDGS